MKHYLITITEKTKTPNNFIGDIVKIMTSQPSPIETKYFNIIEIEGLTSEEINNKLNFLKRLNCNNLNKFNIKNLKEKSTSKKVKLYTLGIIEQYEK